MKSRQDLEGLDNSRISFILKCWGVRWTQKSDICSIPFESKHSRLFVLLLIFKKKSETLKTQSKTDSGDILEGLCRGLRTWKNDPEVCNERD